MWEKANVAVRMTANYIPGALWLLRWQTHTLQFLLGLFDGGFRLRTGPLGGHFRFNRCTEGHRPASAAGAKTALHGLRAYMCRGRLGTGSCAAADPFVPFVLNMNVARGSATLPEAV
jgi:hypothetical protein